MVHRLFRRNKSLCVPMLEMMRGHKELGVRLSGSRIVVDTGCFGDVNKSWCAPMFVECRLTVVRDNALGVLLGDSRIVVDIGCLGDVMSLGVILCW